MAMIINRQVSYRGRSANLYKTNKRTPFYPPRARYARENRKNQRLAKAKVLLNEEKIDFDIVTWNIQGKGTPEEIDKAIYKTAKRRPHIVCLQEANLPASGGETEHYKWLCSGTHGSAILVCKSVSIESKGFEQLCEQICVAELTKENITFKVISCYVPPPTHYVSEDIWAKLDDLARAIPSNMMFVLCGDLNAQVGSSDTTEVEKKFFGKQLFHTTSNENGVKLRKLLRTAHLKAISTFPQQHKAPEMTFKDGNVKTQQDFIIIPNLRKGYMDDLHTDRHSDYKHFLVCCKLSICKMFRDETSVKFEDEVGEKSEDKAAVKSEDKAAVKSEDKSEDGTKEKESAEETADEKGPVVVVSTWNIQGATPAKVDSLLSEHKMPVVCLQGLFLTSDEDIKTENYTWYSTKKQWAKNVAILVKKEQGVVMINFDPVSEFLCAADIEVQGKPVKVICCYLPTKSDPQFETVATKLKELLKGIPEGTFFILAGDFSSKVIPIVEHDAPKVDYGEGIDENGAFMKKLARDLDLSLKDTVFKRFRGYGIPSFSQVTETAVGNPHLILVPNTFKDKIRTNFFIRWIPFFENSIFSLWCMEQKRNFVHFQEVVDDKCEVQVNEEDGVQTSSGEQTNVESIDGLTYKSTQFEYSVSASDDEEEADDLEKIVSPEDLDKFKSKEIPAEDLQRILKDFVIFHGANSKSSCDLSPIYLLVKSFKAGKLGNLISEHVEILDESVEKKIGLIVRIKWKGIVLAERNGDGTDRMNRFRFKRAVTTAVLNKLGQFFGTVKARRSFFNKGQAPILLKDSKLEGIVKVVDKKKYPTVPDVTKYIDEFFTEDTECELLFGKDFTEDEIKEIKQHAKSQKLGYRSFSSKSTQPLKFDSIAVFKKFSPQYLKDKILENKEKNIEHYKYFYIPPNSSSPGMDYRSYICKYEADNFKDETRIVQQHFAELRGLPFAQKRESKPSATSTPAQTKRTGQQSKGGPPAKKGGPQAKRAGDTARGRSNTGRNDRPNDRGQKRRYGSQDEYDGREPFYQQFQRGEYSRNDPSYTRGYNEEIDNRDNRQTVSARDRQWYADNFGDRQRTNPRDPWYPQETTGQREGLNNRENWDYQASGRSQGKRMRLDEAVAEREQNAASAFPRVKLPIWRDLDPLILVWPVTKRSQVEERPKQILEANYPTEIILGPQNSAAVMVTLPMRNRTERKYCLAVGPQSRAAGTALQLIVKHSTVIKPNPTYLCDGATPNFIRYKVPCQTNPRTYLILTRAETGPLTEASIQEILDTFRDSFNEEIFFDKDSYTFQEKMLLMEMADKDRFCSRHFGEASGVADHHVCIYKKKSKYEILEEVLKMRGAHPKYMMSTDRLPPSLGLNIY